MYLAWQKKKNICFFLSRRAHVFFETPNWLIRHRLITVTTCDWNQPAPEVSRRFWLKLNREFDDGFDDGNGNENAKNQWFNWLNEVQQSCCTCSKLSSVIFWRSLPNDDVKFSHWRFWRQREPAAVYLSFSAFKWKVFLPSKRKYNSPRLYNVTNLE